MMKIILYVLFFTTITRVDVNAQSVKVGDKLKGIPACRLGKKITIFEFWSVNCASCIRGFPHLQSVRDRFRGDLEVVLVNKETRAKTDALFARLKEIRRPSFEFISGDTVLHRQVAEFAYPFQVWVDSNHNVLAITNEKLSEAQVADMMMGKAPALTVARKRKVYSSLVQPGIEKWNAPVPYYSYIAACSDVINVGNHSGSAGNDEIRISRDCATIEELYKTAYSEKGKFRFHHWFSVNIDVRDSGGIIDRKYSYDLRVPYSRSATVFNMMQQDLERFFGFKAFVSRSYYKLIELISGPGQNLLATKGGTPISQHKVEKGNGDEVLYIKLENQPFDKLMGILHKYFSEKRMSIESRTSYAYGKTGNIDIELQINLESSKILDSLRTELEKYDLRIHVQDIPLDVLTVTDK